MKKRYTLVEHVHAFADNGFTKMHPFIVAGELSSNYIGGTQHSYIDKRFTIQRFPTPDNNTYMERKAFNRLFPIYLSRYGILTNNMPIPGFKPLDNTAETTHFAITGNKLISDFMTDINYKKLYCKAVALADIYGMCWIKTGIDWSAGEAIETNKFTVKEEEETKTYVQTVFEGRPFMDVVPISEVFIDDINATDVSELKELVHRRIFSKEYIQAKWGVEITKSDTKLLNKNQKTGTKEELHTYVYEYYRNPDAIYPDGRFSVVIGDKLIHDGPLPFKNAAGDKRVIPFDRVILQKLPDHFVGVSIYPQIIPIQDTFNSVKNRYLEYVNHIAIGQFFVYDQSIADKSSFNNRPGRLIKLKRNSRAPIPVQKEKLDTAFTSYLTSLEQDMLITAGISQLTAYGMSKSNMRTDGVVNKIDESDQNKLVNAIDNISDTTIEVFKKILYLEKERQDILAEKLKVPRIDKYINKYDVGDINAEMISIVNRDFLMQSDQILDKKLLQAQNMGLYNPQAGLSFIAKKELLDTLQSNYLKDTLDPIERATHDLITEEHSNILHNLTVDRVETFHVHEQHIYEHNLFRISPTLRKLKKSDKDRYEKIMQALDTHIKQHEQYVQQSTNTNVYNNAKAIM